MIYEFKTYRATDGNIEKLIERFEQATLPVFARLGMQVIGCWTSEEEPDAFFYQLRFESNEERKAAWAAFSADPEWKSAKTASETNGPLLASQTVVLLNPTSFSPVGGNR